MAVYFNVNGSGFKGARVPAVAAALTGFYANDGTPYAPDRSAVRALLPIRWRGAFDRAGGFWWDKHQHPATQAYVEVRDAQGRRLTTIYANANEEA